MVLHVHMEQTFHCNLHINFRTWDQCGALLNYGTALVNQTLLLSDIGCIITHAKVSCSRAFRVVTYGMIDDCASNWPQIYHCLCLTSYFSRYLVLRMNQCSLCWDVCVRNWITAAHYRCSLILFRTQMQIIHQGHILSDPTQTHFGRSANVLKDPLVLCSCSHRYYHPPWLVTAATMFTGLGSQLQGSVKKYPVVFSVEVELTPEQKWAPKSIVNSFCIYCVLHFHFINSFRSKHESRY